MLRFADVKRLLEPVSLMSDVITVVQTAGAALGTIVAGLGATATIFDGGAVPEVAGLVLPLRVVLLLIVAMSLGFGLGAVLRRLSDTRNEVFGFLSYFVAFVWGCLLIGSVIWAADTRGLVPEAALFTLVGLCTALLTALYTLRRSEAVPASVLQAEADGILVFVMTSVGMLLLHIAGGA